MVDDEDFRNRIKNADPIAVRQILIDDFKLEDQEIDAAYADWGNFRAPEWPCLWFCVPPELGVLD
jgi:hypothetical protein